MLFEHPTYRVPKYTDSGEADEHTICSCAVVQCVFTYPRQHSSSATRTGWAIQATRLGPLNPFLASAPRGRKGYFSYEPDAFLQKSGGVTMAAK
jgi:hypothetical protein